MKKSNLIKLAFTKLCVIQRLRGLALLVGYVESCDHDVTEPQRRSLVQKLDAVLDWSLIHSQTNFTELE